MPEVIHAHAHTHANTNTQKPVPALPVSADVLLEREGVWGGRFTRDGNGERVSTGCGVLGGVFSVRTREGGGGGVERGVVLGVSGGDEGVLISLHLLTSILLPHLHVERKSQVEHEGMKSKKNTKTKVKATIITSTASSFPLPLLSKILKFRLLASDAETAVRENDTGNYVSKTRSGGKGGDMNVEKEVEERVKMAMEMISLTRVFDIEGLDEILTDLESHTPASPAPPQSPPREIIDSQASDISLSPGPITRSTIPDPDMEKDDKHKDEDEGIEILIINSLTPLLTSHLSYHEKSKAHATLTTLSRKLHTLTKTQNLLTVLHNTLVSPPPHQHLTPHPQTHYPVPTTTTTTPPTPPTPPHHKPPNPIFTIFSSSSTHHERPALGQVFAQFVDLHVFISSLPKSRRDAEILYTTSPSTSPLAFNPTSVFTSGPGSVSGLGFGNEEKEKEKEKVNTCYVLEVLKDESPSSGTGYGAREERWIPLEVGGDGCGFLPAMALPAFSGPPATANAGTGMDVGGVAKVWGFGGRRV